MSAAAMVMCWYGDEASDQIRGGGEIFHFTLLCSVSVLVSFLFLWSYAVCFFFLIGKFYYNKQLNNK
jgi:hypothetical protein